MKVLEAGGVDEAIVKATLLFLEEGVPRSSRNGPTLEIATPLTTVYRTPQNRVSFLGARDANPFFHLFESVWMLGGRSDLKSLILFNNGMSAYSDDGQLVRGSAYGARWRNWFNYDQIEDAIRKLTEDKDTRRVVLTQWDAATDPVVTSRDIPCNLQTILYRRADGSLDITVTNRSNDYLLGAYGSNVVHFSLTQEYIAAGVGAPIGRYYQVSNSFHAYTENIVWKRVSELVKAEGVSLLEAYPPACRYVPLFKQPSERADFDQDNHKFLDLIKYYTTAGYSPMVIANEIRGCVWHTEFFDIVMAPMTIAWLEWKYTGRAGPALESLRQGDQTVDWLTAGAAWLRRRKAQ